jgi:hypothetical protein
MEKIPTLFERVYKDDNVLCTVPVVRKGFEWVLDGEGIATVKWDGSCCAIFNGELYKRYDAKRGKKPPEGAIPCCDPDPVTGHWPHWVKCDPNNPADKWFIQAFERAKQTQTRADLYHGTFEAVGPHFNGNPYKYEHDKLIQHGIHVVNVERSFEGIRRFLENHSYEGLVFWKDGAPQCKIKRTDFRLSWPIRKEDNA